MKKHLKRGWIGDGNIFGAIFFQTSPDIVAARRVYNLSWIDLASLNRKSLNLIFI